MYVADFGNNRVRYITHVVAVKNITDNKFKLSTYPNPNHGSFQINVETEPAENIRIAITDMTGRKVQEVHAASNKPVRIQMDVSGL